MSLDRALARLRRTLDGKPVPRRRVRDTPRERVAAHLLAHGIEVHPDDIRVPQGFYRQIKADVCERWNVVGHDVKTGRRIEVTGTESLTMCYRGITLEPNTPDTCLYGDWVASPIGK